MRFRLLYIVLIGVTCWGCSNVRLDPYDVRLPIYSAEGLNVAGAIVNDKPFLSERPFLGRNRSSFEVFPNDSISFKFMGYDSDSSYITIGFSFFPETSIDTLTDILDLDQQEYNLVHTNIDAYLRVEDKDPRIIKDYENATSGKLYLREVRQIQFATPNLPKSFVLSGTFGFDIEDSLANKMSVHYGRFDFTLKAEDNLFIRD